MAVKFSQSSLAKSSITPPHLNRQSSYSTRKDSGRASVDATSALANVASRTASPGRKSSSSSPLGSPTERRTSWEDCKATREGYISFPDFDSVQSNFDCRRKS
ncbi:hypothetical protein AC579_5082 [Pseudocercospora musae]|uniref:Uncharacterized protein n=1 Tax=Pseudocercospora musae TaxID=113226 RepID=A0A139INC6_9PEZI|nr:hypothetical protein AC579_5082 [Pseudocercospora musae]